MAITVVVLALTIVNVIGVREASMVNNVFIVSKLAPLLLFVIAGLFFINRASFTTQSSNYAVFQLQCCCWFLHLVE
jgi:amino acid transporter